MKNRTNKKSRNPILRTTLVAGTLDIGAAFLNAWLSNAVTPKQVLAYIASGIWGKAAYSGGHEILFFGLLFHFIIVWACVVSFFGIYPKWQLLHRSVLLNAFLIAMAAWLITTQVLVRLSRIPTPRLQLSGTLIAVGILVVCVGLPIAYAARRHHKTIR